MKTLNLSEVCSRIALQAPYFAFLDLESRSPEAIHGTFDAEHQTGYERGPVAPAELVRHLATLGSCAAVIEGSPAPTYYLGTKGRLKVLRNSCSCATDGKFEAFSEVVSKDKRSLVARSTVSSGKYLAYFHCEYQALPEPIFARTFKSYRTPMVPSPLESPYREPIELDFEEPQEQSLVAHSRPLPKTRFAGHFLEYPAWPASVYGENISRVVSRLLHHMLDKEVEFDTVRMDIDALRLISASESVSFHVTCASASKLLSHYIFTSEVRSGDIVAAKIDMEVYV
jgi:hypothetical protein